MNRSVSVRISSASKSFMHSPRLCDSQVPVSKEINFVTVQQQISQSGSDLVAAMQVVGANQPIYIQTSTVIRLLLIAGLDSHIVQMDNSFSCAMWSEMERYNFDVTPVRVSSDLSNAHHSNLSLWEQVEW